MGKHHQKELVAIERTAPIFIEPEDLGYETMQEPQGTLRELGRCALLRDGFSRLEEAASPYQKLRENLEKTIIDQPTAIAAIIDAFEASDARMPSDQRPIANLAFLGPTGVGKSETAKALSQFLGEKYGEEANIIKIECAAFQHGHEVSRLTGSPAGYVGYGDKPILHPTNVEKPGTVILFDEIEKGSAQLRQVMLHILEDGELRMSKGDKIAHFRDTVIIMTSNVGAAEMAAKLNAKPGFGFGDPLEKATTSNHKELDAIALQKFERDPRFAPEFIGRIDQRVVFHALTEEGMLKVLDTKIDQYNAELDREHGAHIELSSATCKHLVSIAMKEPHLGARPLIRALKNNVFKHLGRYIGAGDIRIGTHVLVGHASEEDEATEGNELVFYAKQKPFLALPPSPSSMPKHRQKHDVAEDIPA